MFRKATSTRSKIIGLGILAVAALSLFLAYTAIDGVPLYPYKYVTAVFANAGNLTAHNDVRVAGARVGQISSISFKGNVADVRMQIQPSTKVYANATATVGTESVLGEEYVSLDPGSPSAGKLAHSQIAESATTPPVEIDQILNILEPKEADAAAATIQTLGAGFGGQQDSISTLLGSAPTLLPNIGTTTATLSATPTRLIPLIEASKLLASRFQGRTTQVAEMISQMSTTFQALDTQQGKSIESTISDAEPTLPVLTPALNTLADVAAATRQAVTDMRPGLAALGQGTPNLRALLVEGVAPLAKVPAVANQSLPGLRNFTVTLVKVKPQVVPLMTQLEAQSSPLLSYLEPYTPDMTELWNNLDSALTSQAGDINGDWLRLSLVFGAGEATGSEKVSECRDPYPTPTEANADSSTPAEGCPG